MRERAASYGYSRMVSCSIPDLERLLIWISGDFDQQTLDVYSDIFRCGMHDSWVSAVEESETVVASQSLRRVTADGSLQIPKVHISPGLGDGRPHVRVVKRVDGRPVAEDEQKEPSPRAFFAIVQGRSGALKSKLIWRSTRDDIGNEIFYEAANGYSTVFSGAVLKSQVNILSTAERFQKVQSVQEMDRLEAEGKGVVGVMC